MATQQPAPAPAPAPEQPKPATPAYPGGMASDPAAALANEIVTNIKGAAERFKTAVENAPALKALLDQSSDNLTAEVAQSIRRFADDEVSKATGGMLPKK